ncbi:Vps52 / Sac2 family protein [Cavenderia fasciculata]|uniref:Vps52 / Sac2 family protein n=1 Tax=Cavenderia fasciculata TaxID=261658 RepID=F4PPM8_CACFS|nr:Vps52 / Sac2 family protein [Cavenderia fasciculata]EGG22341.1 Vps52 / Sac2 family protein [Cavenderia fasciculata]|eukprot:XP_004360192.1 Vps52 / Sac2 family protein [Cavenderia fasciculata]
MFTPPSFMKQKSKALMINLAKPLAEADDMGELDITSILRSDIDGDISIQDQETIKDALKKGIDLRQYSKQVEDELNTLDKETISDYFLERDEFLELYNHVEVVDGVLASLEKMLNDYYNELKSVGSEMSSLQERSMTMNYKLNNRKLTKEKLYEFIDVITISPEFSNKLLRDNINEEYISCLSKLDTKITLFDDYKKISPTICTSNEPQLSKLTVASIQKIQKFLRDTLSNFKKLSDRRHTQNQLAKMSYLFQFLFKYSTYIASEVINTYVENSDKYFTTYYKNYSNSLLKMQEDAPTKADLIGIGTNKLKTLFGGSNSAKEKERDRSTVSNNLLNSSATANSKRGVDMLSNEVLEAPVIEPPASASFFETNFSPTSSSNLPTIKYPFEQIYRSLVFFLMDITISETKFVSEFFLGGEDMIQSIFIKPINLLIETTETYLTNNYDIVNIILMIGMLYKYRKYMVEKDIGVLNNMFDKLLSMSMARFSKVLEMIMESIRSLSMKDLKPINHLQPHYLMRRYADYLVALYSVQPFIPTESQQFVSRCAGLLRDSLEQLLARMGDEIAEKDKSSGSNKSPPLTGKVRDQVVKKTPNQTILTANNYGLILQAMAEHGAPEEDTSVQQIQAAMARTIQRYVEDQLAELKYFTPMFAFTNEWAPLVESNVKISLDQNPSFNGQVVESILSSFKANWESVCANVKANSAKYFEHCPLARAISFDVLLEILYTNYRQMIIIVNKHFPTLQQSPHYKPIQIVTDMRSMNSNLTLDDIPLV